VGPFCFLPLFSNIFLKIITKSRIDASFLGKNINNNKKTKKGKTFEKQNKKKKV